MREGVPEPAIDGQTAAAITIAWVVALNKPFYPLYVWWLTGEGVAASFGTVIAAPFFAAVALWGRKNAFAVRLGVPLIGTVDTVLAGKFLGQESGTEFFLAPCLMLVALNFTSTEKWWQRGMAAAVFLAFAAFHGRMGVPVYSWPAAETQSLLTLNAFSVASLMAFIALRYAGTERR